MKTLTLLLLASVLALAGCASKPVDLLAEPARQSMTIVATLATNACEAETAADYTAVITARRRAAMLLRAKRIAVEDAVEIQRLADQARTSLDVACREGKADRVAISNARHARERIAKLLEASHAR